VAAALAGGTAEAADRTHRRATAAAGADPAGRAGHATPPLAALIPLPYTPRGRGYPDPMEGPLDPRDPALLRVSDADRHKVAEILRQAAGEGRLDLDELDERLESAYAAKTYADLVPITADLPSGAVCRCRRPAPSRPPVL